MPTRFSETINGYPSLEIDPPYEMLAEFIGIYHALSHATELLAVIDDVVDGRQTVASCAEDYADLHLSHANQNAHLRLEFPHLDKELEYDIPLGIVRDILAQWVEYLKHRQ